MVKLMNIATPSMSERLNSERLKQSLEKRGTAG